MPNAIELYRFFFPGSIGLCYAVLPISFSDLLGFTWFDRMGIGLFLDFISFPDFNCFTTILTGFYWVKLYFSGFYWVLMGLTGFDWVLPSFNGFDWV